MKKWDSFNKLMNTKKKFLLILGFLILGFQLFILIQLKKYIDTSKSWPLLNYPKFIILYIVFLEPLRETIKSRSFFRLKLQPTG